MARRRRSFSFSPRLFTRLPSPPAAGRSWSTFCPPARPPWGWQGGMPRRSLCPRMSLHSSLRGASQRLVLGHSPLHPPGFLT